MHADDHRNIARDLDLLHFQEEAPGMVFWHAHGLQVVRVLEDAARRQYARGGYAEVRSPQVLRQSVWDASGHWAHFRDNMFQIPDEHAVAGLKPVSCPAHVHIVKRRHPSWRDLPIRLGELGLCHRNEQAGALHGLLRLRQFTQDDGHIFCSEEQLLGEIERFCLDVPRFYAAFGFDRVEVALSTRPVDRIGDDAVWDQAEHALAVGSRAAFDCFAVQPGEGAFYGPKLEFSLRDRQGRLWQCGTLQLDFFLPRRFDLTYADPKDERKHPIMLHRALFGSVERFLGILLEHHGRRMPLWLAPVQVRVLPVHPDQEAWAEEVRAALVAAGLRAEVDARSESLGRRVAEAHAVGVGEVLVVGAREVASRSVARRLPTGSEVLLVAETVAGIAERATPPL